MKNYYVVQGDVATIKIESKHGIFWVLIDTKDLEIMPEGAISVLKAGNYYYAVYHQDGQKMEYLHRLIMGFPEGLEIDHWNHDTLDNRREHLRVVTHQVNQHNRNGKGCTWIEARQKWMAQIRLKGKNIHLGYFKNGADAEHQHLLAKEIIH